MPHPRTVYPDQKPGICRVCKGKVTAKRRKFFCSRQCAHVYSKCCDWRYIRREVFKRDGGACVKCGSRVKEAFDAWWAMRGMVSHERWIAAGRILRGRAGDVTKSWWECDHIKTVAESIKAGESPNHFADNLRVLCLPCHDERRRKKKKGSP